ncbi:hypothetical protein M405DRAFT_866382 [Rhizopogon salebrosus TDB-379]|nr:hypothetical protein M405DRAFT_866382 [Rhizopogon salebrosus TDB-379]
MSKTRKVLEPVAGGNRQVTNRTIRWFAPRYHSSVTRKAVMISESFDVKQTVTESLEAGGVPPSSVEMIVLTHLHWDQ